MMRALQGIFRPGHSRHEDKKHGRVDVIRGIQTMRVMCEDAHRFGRFVRGRWPEVREVGQITPAMAGAYIADLMAHGLSRNYLKRVAGSLRKVDLACRKARIFPAESPELLPLDRHQPHPRTGLRPHPRAYKPDEVERLLAAIRVRDPRVADLLKLMWIAGLRISEACYLRAEDIHAEEGWIALESNANHTKGGRPRRVKVQPDQREFLEAMREVGREQPDGHLFPNRRTLDDRAYNRVRGSCADLGIECLGTHGFRKGFAAQEYRRAVEAGRTDRQALLAVSRQLGHNRLSVAARSYVPLEVRVRAGEVASGNGPIGNLMEGPGPC
jgi:integrase